MTTENSKPKNDLKKREMLRLSNAESNRLTRECICTALIRLMNQYPFDKITITSIINRSGVSRAGFYRNYSSKEEVLQEIGTAVSDLISTALNDKKYRDHPRQWYLDCFLAIKKHQDWFRLLLKAKMPPDFIFHAQHKNDDDLMKLPPKERYHQIAVQSAVKQVVIAWFENGMAESPEEMADICQSLLH